MIFEKLKAKYWLLTLLLFIGLFCGLVMLVLLPQSIFSADQVENNEIDDQISCNGFPEDMLGASPDLSPHNDPASVRDDEGDDLIDYQSNPDDFYNSFQAKGSLPRVEVYTPATAFTYGAEVLLNANIKYFKTSQQNMGDIYIAWFVDGIPFQGIAAGADDSSLQGLIVSDAGNAVQSCNPVNRIPMTDVDGDGMDDDWERRYFVDTGIFNTIEEVLPNDDYDRDGILPIHVMNTTGNLLTVVPPVVGQDPLDGKFTNREEYVWGTDPTNADTDGDGFRDGEDILGAGQLILKFINKQKFGEAPTLVRATAVGAAVQSNAANERLIKIDSATLQVFTTNDEELEGKISLSKNFIIQGERLQARYIPTGTKAEDQTLDIQWYLDGELQKDSSGLSRTILEFGIPETKTLGSTLIVTAAATNPATGQVSRASATVRIGENVFLSYLQDQVFANQTIPLTVNFLDDVERQNYVYKWYVNNSMRQDISGPGRNILPLEIGKKFTGDIIDVKVVLFEIATSERVMEITEKVVVVAPKIDLIVTPFYPEAQENITVLADLTRFPGNLLEFDWQVDGIAVPTASQSSQINFTAGVVGTQHQVNLGALNKDPGGQYAEASAIIEVYPSPTATSSFFSNNPFGRLLARMHFDSPLVFFGYSMLMLIIFLALAFIKKLIKPKYVA